MFSQRSNRHNPQSGSTMRRRIGSDPSATRSNDRLIRFQQFLENRGCPVRLNLREAETEIRWIG